MSTVATTTPAAPSSWWAPALRHDGLSVDQPGPTSIPWRRPWVCLAAFVASMIAVTVLVMVVALVAGSPPAPSASVAQLLGSIVGYAVMLVLERRAGGAIEVAGRRVGGLGLGLLLGAALVSVAVGLITVLGFREFTGTNPDAPLLFPLLQLGLTAGISEEIIFRGVFHRYIERWLGTWGATAAGGLLFGLAHITNPEATLWGALAIAIEAGLLFGVLYALTRSLWVVIGLHAAWNLLQGPVYGSVVSGATQGSGLLVSHPVGPELLSGGRFGIEASLITVALLLGVTIVLARMVVRRGLVVAPRWRRPHA